VHRSAREMLPFPWEASPVLGRFPRIPRDAQFLENLEPTSQHWHSHYQLLDGLPALRQVLEDFFQRAGNGGMSSCDAHDDGIGRASRNHLASHVASFLRTFTVVHGAVGCQGLRVWLLAVPMRPLAHHRPKLLPYESYLPGWDHPGRTQASWSIHFRVSRTVGLTLAWSIPDGFASAPCQPYAAFPSPFLIVVVYLLSTSLLHYHLPSFLSFAAALCAPRF